MTNSQTACRARGDKRRIGTTQPTLLVMRGCRSGCFNSSPVAIAIIEVNTNTIVDVNDSFIQLLGFSRNELINHVYYELNLFRKQEENEKLLSRLRHGLSIKNYEITAYTKKNTPLTVQLSAVIFGLEGTRYFLTTLPDITEKKKSDEKQRKINEELELRVKERTLELTLMLEREKELNELKSRFVTTASHEFRTPLAALITSVSIIQLVGR